MMDKYIRENACIKSEKWKENKIKSRILKEPETQDCAENRSNDRHLLKQHDTLSFLILLHALAGGMTPDDSELLKVRDTPGYLIHLLGKVGIEVENVEDLNPLVNPIKNEKESPTTKAMTWIGAMFQTRYLKAQAELT
jgi:hypothetical protein